jgi:hypothetical protein
LSTKHIFTPNLHIYSLELEQAVIEGFRIDPNNPPTTWLQAYDVTLIRDDVKEELKAVFAESPDTIDFSSVASVLPSSEEAGKRGRKPKAV